MNPFIRYRLSLLLILSAMTCLLLHGRTDPAANIKVAPKPVKKIAVKPAAQPVAAPAVKENPPPAKSQEGEETTPAKYDPHDPDEAQYEVDEKDPTGDHYTSVIIDVSDFHVTRSMSPKICREDGTKVWPTLAYIDPEFVLSYGIVVYARSMEDARAHKRVGKNPLVIRALRHGESADDPVLSATDVDAILAANKRNKCLDKFKVIFILDKPAPAPMEAAVH